MKKNRVTKLGYLSVTLGSLFFSTSCAVKLIGFKTGETTAQIKLPETTTTIVLLNRTRITTSLFNKKLFNGKDLNAIRREGTIDCIQGSKDVLYRSESKYMPFDNLLIHLSEQSNNFPRPLSVIEIKEFCSQSNNAVLVSLELYQPQIGTETPVYFQANAKTGRKEAAYHIPLLVGWRVYNPNDGSIIDEYKTETLFVAKAEEITDTLNKLPLYADALKKASYTVGQNYINRIMVKNIYTSRYYYSKGNKDFQAASKFLKKQNWEAAKQLYFEQMNNRDAEIASKAIYNLAVCYEKEGDLKKALEFAQKSDERYKNKYAPSYIYELRKKLGQ